MPWDWLRWNRKRRETAPPAAPGGGERDLFPPPRPSPPLFTGAATQETITSYWHPATRDTEEWGLLIPPAYRNADFHTFINNLSTIAQLARSSEETVFHHWQKLHNFYPPGWPAANVYFDPYQYWNRWLMTHPWDQR